MLECQQQPRLWVELRLHLAADLCWCFTSLWTDDYAFLHKNSDLVTFQVKKRHLQLFKFDFFDMIVLIAAQCTLISGIDGLCLSAMRSLLWTVWNKNGTETHNQSVSANKTCHSHYAGLVWRHLCSKHNLARLLTSHPKREWGFSMTPVLPVHQHM